MSVGCLWGQCDCWVITGRPDCWKHISTTSSVGKSDCRHGRRWQCVAGWAALCLFYVPVWPPYQGQPTAPPVRTALRSAVVPETEQYDKATLHCV